VSWNAKIRQNGNEAICQCGNAADASRGIGHWALGVAGLRNDQCHNAQCLAKRQPARRYAWRAFLHCRISALPHCRINLEVSTLKIPLGIPPFIPYLSTTLFLPISSETEPNLLFPFPVNAWTQILALVNI
jgi:hypothetical protein